MIGFRELPTDSSWRQGYEQRLRDGFRRHGYPQTAVEPAVAEETEASAGWTAHEVTVHGRPAGYVALEVVDGSGRIGDLHVDAPEEDRAAVRVWAEQWCAERGATRVKVGLTEPDPLFDDYPVRGQTRMRTVDPQAPLPAGFGYRPLTEAEYPAWAQSEADAYIADILRAGMLSAEEAQKKSDEDYARLLPQGLDTPDNTLLVLEQDGARVGTLWLKHDRFPGVTFGYALEVDEQHRGKGLGRASMAAGERATAAGGDTAMMFNVFGGNAVAMSLYDKVGFTVVRENRSIDLP